MQQSIPNPFVPMDESVANNNRMIGIYLGGELIGDHQIQMGPDPREDRYFWKEPVNYPYHGPYNGNEAFTPSDIKYLAYHASWDAQIPVWSKVILGDLRDLVIKNTYGLSDYRYNKLLDDYAQAITNNKVYDGYKLLIQAITWQLASK